MIAGTSVRQKAAATGPTSPPLPPARLTPPSTAAATEFSVMKLPEYGVPMPVVAVSARPDIAAKKPPIEYARMRVRFTLTPDRYARSRLEPIANSAEPVRRQRIGNHATSRITAITIAPAG